MWVSLLRAVNLGARNKLNMPALRESLAAAGFADVRTYVQSGNVITRSSHRSAAKVAGAVREVIAADCGMDVPVIVRSPVQLAAVVTANPYADAAQRPTLVSVVFLDREPDAGRAAALRECDFAPDSCRLVGRDLYLSFATTSQGSRLNAAVGRLGVQGTARNWRTVLALVEMSQSPRR